MRGAPYAKAFLDDHSRQFSSADYPSTLKAILSAELMLLFKIMADHDLEFGFRSANEILRYSAFAYETTGPATTEQQISVIREALDAQVLQKLLPRLHGSRKRLEPLLLELATYCTLDHDWTATGIQNEAALRTGCQDAKKSNSVPTNSAGPFLPMCASKLARMLHRVRTHGFASFAEA